MRSVACSHKIKKPLETNLKALHMICERIDGSLHGNNYPSTQTKLAFEKRMLQAQFELPCMKGIWVACPKTQNLFATK